MNTTPRGSRLAVAVSLASVARRAGVSITTVSRIVNGVPNKASDATVARVREAIAALGYRPGSIGRALRNRTSRVVGVLVANLANPSMAAIAASIEDALRDGGFIMALCDTHERADIQDEYLLEMRAQLACAVILVGAVPSRALDDARARETPLVFVNRPDPGDPGSAYIGVDNRRAGADVAALLLRWGVRQAAILHPSLPYTSAQWRIAGFMDAMRAAGVEAAALPCATIDHLDHMAIGYHAMDALLAGNGCPRMIVCMSDLLAYGGHRRVIEAGFSVPGDFLFFGFDDNPINPWIADWLNSVRVPFDQYGPALLRQLKALWSGGEARQVILEHELVVRHPWR